MTVVIFLRLLCTMATRFEMWAEYICKVIRSDNTAGPKHVTETSMRLLNNEHFNS